MKIKKINFILLSFFLFLTLLGAVEGAVSTYPDKMERGYHFSNNLNDGVGSDTLAETGTVAYVDDKNSVSSQAVELTASTDVLKTDSFVPVNQSGESFSLWLNMSDAVSGWLMHGNSVSWSDMNWYCDATGCNVKRDSSAANAGTQSFGTLFDGTWRHLVIVLTTNNITIYNNGAKVGSTALSEAREKDLNKNLQLAGNGATDDIFDEFIHFNKALTNAEVQELYTGGDSYDQWDSSGVTLDNFSTVGSSSYKNSVPVSISTAWATVNSVTITVNVTSAYYPSVSLTTNASTGSNSECRITVDGSSVTSATRTLSASTLGNFKLISGASNLSVGNHTVAVQCRKNGGSNYIIQNSELTILHLYDDVSSTTINYTVINTTGLSVNNVDTLLASFNFTTSNTTGTTNVPSHVFHERVTYTYGTATEITTYLKNEDTGEICGNYSRYGSAGSAGSVGTTCLFDMLNSSTTYNYGFYGFTTSGTGSIDNLLINTYNINTNETSVNTTSLSYSVPSATLTAIANISLSNPLGGSFSVFTDAGIMVTGNASQNAYFYISDSVDSVKFWRTLSTAGNGNVNVQNTFSATGTSTKTYTLYAYCPSGCEVNGGDLSAFVTDSDPASTGTFFIYAHNDYNSTTIESFNATVKGAEYTTTNGSITALGTGTISVLVEAENFFSNTTSHDTTTSLNASLLKYTEIRAYNYGSGTAVNNFTLNSSVGNTSTTNGIAYLPLTSNISVTINSPDIAGTSEYIDQIQAYNFTVYAQNSITITFRDSQTEAIVNNVTLDYWSNSDSGTNSTSNGTLYLTLLEPETYTFRYNSTDYPTNFYFITITNDTYTDLTLYLNPNTTSITVEVYEDESPVEGAVVYAQKYYVATNSYLTVAGGSTNPDGETVMELETGSNFYKFVVVYNGETVRVTNPFVITGTTVRINVILGIPPLQNYNIVQNIDGSVVFNENTNNFRFTFSDSSLNNRQYCLTTYRRGSSSDTLLDYSCTTGSSGTILYGVSNVSGLSYYSRGTVNIGGRNYVIGQDSFTFNAVNLGSAALLAQILLSMAFATAGFLAVELIFLLVPLSVVLGGVMNLHAIPLTYTAPLVIVGFVLMLILRRNR